MDLLLAVSNTAQVSDGRRSIAGYIRAADAAVEISADTSSKHGATVLKIRSVSETLEAAVSMSRGFVIEAPSEGVQITDGTLQNYGWFNFERAEERNTWANTGSYIGGDGVNPGFNRQSPADPVHGGSFSGLLTVGPPTPYSADIDLSTDQAGSEIDPFDMRGLRKLRLWCYATFDIVPLAQEACTLRVTLRNITSQSFTIYADINVIDTDDQANYPLDEWFQIEIDRADFQTTGFPICATLDDFLWGEVEYVGLTLTRTAGSSKNYLFFDDGTIYGTRWHPKVVLSQGIANVLRQVDVPPTPDAAKVTVIVGDTLQERAVADQSFQEAEVLIETPVGVVATPGPGLVEITAPVDFEVTTDGSPGDQPPGSGASPPTGSSGYDPEAYEDLTKRPITSRE
jgi:hypothetical protein